MSDLEKVHGYACMLGAETPIQLRWEGAGDSGHPAKLLSSLKHQTYLKSNTKIKYHAVINLYESEDDNIYKTAASVMATVHMWGAGGQTYEMKGNVDVTRDSGFLKQNQAHIMFVRNIMPTNEKKESKTDQGGLLQTIHKGAIRQRANSLTVDGGQLRLGMSGAPGLINASQSDRLATPVSKLFVGAMDLAEQADHAGLKVRGGPERLGQDDYDEGGVMKNSGQEIGIKKTFYLTFVRPAKAK